MHSSALIDGVLVLRSRSFRTAAAHFPIGVTGHHYRHSSAVRSLGRRKDSVPPVVIGLHQSSSAEESPCSHSDQQNAECLHVLIGFQFMYAAQKLPTFDFHACGDVHFCCRRIAHIEGAMLPHACIRTASLRATATAALR